MGLFDSAPDEQRRRVLDFLASKSGAPDSLVRPPEQADPVPPEAAPPAAPMAAPPPAPAPEPLHDAAHDRASMMAALERAQAADEAGRASLVRKMALSRFLGNGMSPEQIQLAQPRGVQNLMQGHELGSHLDTEGRAAQEFPYKLRGEAAKASQEEAGAALTGAKVPYAGAEAAADARMKGSHADLFEQQATKGKADLAESERLRTDEWDPNGVATQVARQILESTGQKAPPGPYAAWKHLLPEAVKLHVADKAAQARVQASGMGEGAPTLTPDALDQAAELYATTGQLPPLSMGKSSGIVKSKIVNRAAELHPDANLAGNKATYHADQGSLAKLQAQSDAVNAFERTALANLDQFLDAAKGVVDTKSPLFNMPARRFAEKVAGDPKLTKFNVARQVAVQEIGKVLGGAVGGGVISDSARHEVESLLSPDASLAQIEQAAEILRKDMHNRRAAYEAEIGAVRARAGGGKAPPVDADKGGAGKADPYAAHRAKLKPGEVLIRRGGIVGATSPDDVKPTDERL